MTSICDFLFQWKKNLAITLTDTETYLLIVPPYIIVLHSYWDACICNGGETGVTRWKQVFFWVDLPPSLRDGLLRPLSKPYPIHFFVSPRE